MIVDRWWGWCVDSMWFQHSIFHADMKISYEIKWRFSLVSSQESYDCLDCTLPLVIYIWIYRLILIFVEDYLGVDLSMLHLIWYDMIWYDMIWYDMIWYDMLFVYQYARWETVLSTYLSSNTIIDLIQWSLPSLSS